MKYIILLLLFASCKVYVPANGRYLKANQVFKRMFTKPYSNTDCTKIK